MITILNIILILLAVIIEVTLVPHFFILGGGFNLPFLIMISLYLLGRENYALIWAGLGGILLDLVSPLRFGFFTLIFLASYLILVLISRRKLLEPNRFVILVYFGGFGLLLNLLILIFVSRNGLIPPLIGIIYNVLGGFLVFQIARILIKEKSKLPPIQIE